MVRVTLVRDVRDAMLHVTAALGSPTLCGVEVEHLSGYLFDERRRSKCGSCAADAPPCRCLNCTTPTTISTTLEA